MSLAPYRPLLPLHPPPRSPSTPHPHPPTPCPSSPCIPISVLTLCGYKSYLPPSPPLSLSSLFSFRELTNSLACNLLPPIASPPPSSLPRPCVLQNSVSSSHPVVITHLLSAGGGESSRTFLILFSYLSLHYLSVLFFFLLESGVTCDRF